MVSANASCHLREMTDTGTTQTLQQTTKKIISIPLLRAAISSASCLFRGLRYVSCRLSAYGEFGAVIEICGSAAVPEYHSTDLRVGRGGDTFPNTSACRPPDGNRSSNVTGAVESGEVKAKFQRCNGSLSPLPWCRYLSKSGISSGDSSCLGHLFPPSSALPPPKSLWWGGQHENHLTFTNSNAPFAEQWHRSDSGEGLIFQECHLLLSHSPRRGSAQHKR